MIIKYIMQLSSNIQKIGHVFVPDGSHQDTSLYT